MRVIDPGHVYELDSIDGGEPQRLVFVKREGPRYPGNIGHHPGTQMQEVLRALIERARYVQAQIPCAETEGAIRAMQLALMLMEIRAKRVKGKSFEGHMQFIERLPTCKTCGHVLCEEEHESTQVQALRA